MILFPTILRHIALSNNAMSDNEGSVHNQEEVNNDADLYKEAEELNALVESQNETFEKESKEVCFPSLLDRVGQRRDQRDDGRRRGSLGSHRSEQHFRERRRLLRHAGQAQRGLLSVRSDRVDHHSLHKNRPSQGVCFEAVLLRGYRCAYIRFKNPDSATKSLLHHGELEGRQLEVCAPMVV